MTKIEMQKAANNFDRDLYRLMLAAEDMQKHDASNSWHNVLWHLKDARPFVRRLMSEKDRLAT